MAGGRIVKDHKSHRISGKILQSGKCKDDVFPVKTGGKYINKEAWYNRTTNKIEDRNWDEGPSNRFCEGHLKVTVTSTEAYRKGFELIVWKNKGGERNGATV